uniref:HAT C-terminal dimerisation domain-containing protein n=1 Tax=Meloidogyne floridensis TaxID=298350 RepID=A0A915NLC6_9BILA
MTDDSESDSELLILNKTTAKRKLDQTKETKLCTYCSKNYVLIVCTYCSLFEIVSFWYGNCLQISSGNTTCSSEDRFSIEFSEYISLTESIDIESTNVLKFWMANENRFSILSKVAKSVLAIPATTGSVERMFSQMALHSSGHKSTTGDKRLRNRILMCFNRKYFDI